MEYVGDQTKVLSERPLVLSLFDGPPAVGSSQEQADVRSSNQQVSEEIGCDNCWTVCDCLSCYK